jgi:hypothetical protein
MEHQTIYWANLSQLKSSEFCLKPLMPNIAEFQSSYPRQNHIACPAIRGKHSNTFFSTIPYNISVKIYNGLFLTSDTLILQRQGLYKNSYAFDWDIQRIFFSPFQQIMQVSPAFLHKTSYSQYGHAPSGEFDISKWFRPSSPTFQMWENETEFQAKQGEAHLYYNFPNDKKIKLQEFKMSERLFEIMRLCVDYKFIKPKQSFLSIYEMFEQSGLQKETFTEIQENLLSSEL